jgi:exopolysaccharide biosynthesis polyprenyl glycosylphosphotransferase
MAASESQVPSLYADALEDIQVRRPALSRESFRRAMILSELAADFLTCATAAIGAYFLQLYFGAQVQCPTRQVVAVGLLQGIFAVLLLQRMRASEGDASLLRIRETERAFRTSVQTLLLILFITFLFRLDFPRSAILIALGLTPILLIAQKQAFSSILRILHARGCGIERVVVYGAGETGKHVVSTLFYSPRLGFRPVGVIGDMSAPAGSSMFELGYRRNHSVPVERGPVTPTLLKSLGCSLLIVVMPPACSEDITEVMHAANQAETPVALMSRILPQDRSREASIEVDGWQVAAPSEPSSQWPYLFVKRAMDIVVSSLLLILLGPFLLLVALMIRLGSPGPALFVQKRAGKNGELFNIYKFRSMYTGAPRYDVSPKESSDPRITGLGRFLRRTSLDELPQLLNVFLGNMSLVGPRPEMPFIVELYNDQHRRRLQVAPGITGLWQLSVDRALPIHENIEYDLYYIRNRTVFMDVAILLHTLLFAMGAGV